MAIISIAIRLSSRGPVFFCQTRTGKSGKEIRVLKFRTMTHNKESRFVQATQNDPRVTRLGAVLRRTSLDELPQLLNVIDGSMSLVGPRPHPMALDREFETKIRSLHSRYTVKPGITGMAQIRGYRGETRQLRDMAGRIKYDRLYIERWSVWLDIKILLLTAVKGWKHKNAY